MGMLSYQVYILINPIDDTIFYVGQTCQHLLERLMSHCYHFSNQKASPSGKEVIIRRILNAHLVPIIKCIEIVYLKEYALERERYWIHKLNSQNHPILNKEVNPLIQYETVYTNDFDTETPVLIIKGMKKNCLQCTKEFEGNRKSLFCSDECKRLKGKVPTLGEIAAAKNKASTKQLVEDATGLKMDLPTQPIVIQKQVKQQTSKEMPSGLTKAQILRWLRENR